MQSESTINQRRVARSLGLSVFNPDNSSDEDHAGVHQQQHQPTRKQLPQAPKPLPTPTGTIPQQQQQQQQQHLPYLQRNGSGYHSLTGSGGGGVIPPSHSASSSTSSISIQTSTSSPSFLQRQYTGTNTNYSQSSPTSRYAPGGAGTNYSSSSRSSPAMDSTPPPVTPASTAPPVSLGNDDRYGPGEGLGLNVHEPGPGSSSSGGNEVDYLTYQPSRHLPAYQASASPASATPTYTSNESQPRSSSSSERLLITATSDNEYFAIVDITGAMDAGFIRERIFAKVRIPDEEQHCYSIFRTEVGEGALGGPVTDDQLMIYCAEWANGKGVLKFLVQRKPDVPSVYIPPPHLHSPPLPLSPPIPKSNGVAPPTGPTLSMNTRSSPKSQGAGSIPSTTSDRDRPPWERKSNGYEGDVDGRQQPQQQPQPQPQAQQQPQPAPPIVQTQAPTPQSSISRVGRQQSPAPIDTRRTPRQREPSASSSDSFNFSPASPTGSGVNQLPALGSALNVNPPRRGGTTPTPPSFQASPNPLPLSHRRHESEAAAQEREQALEAAERMQENQRKEYDLQMRRMKVDRDRQSRRQQQLHGGAGGSLGNLSEAIPPVTAFKTQRSDSMDADQNMRGWVLIDRTEGDRQREQSPAPAGQDASTTASRQPFQPPPRSASFSRDASGSTGWTPATPSHLVSPPSESPRVTSPSTIQLHNRPYPHSQNSIAGGFGPIRTATGSTTGGGMTPTTSRHPPTPGSAKYPTSRSTQGLPAGASDPRMRMIEQRSPPLGGPGFYPAGIPPSYSSGGASSPRGTSSTIGNAISSSNQKTTTGEVGSPPGSRLLHSARSIPDLRQYNPAPSTSNVRTTLTTAQLPVGKKTSALPSSLNNDSVGLYSRNPPPPSPSRLPPSRPILSPSSFYSSGSGARSPATASSMDQLGGSGVARSLGPVSAAAVSSPSAGFFSGGVFADGPLTGRGLRSKQSHDKLRDVFDRAQPPPSRYAWQPINISGSAPGTSILSSTLRVDTQSKDNQNRGGVRPSSDGDLVDAQGRPSPIESTPAHALARLESRRPSVPALVTNQPPSNLLDSMSPLSSTMSPISGLMSAADGTLMPIPHAVVTPSSPMEDGNRTDNANGAGGRPLDSTEYASGVASPAVSATSSQELTDDGSEGTLRPGDRSHWMSMMGSDNDADGESNGGTLRSRSSHQVPTDTGAVANRKRGSVRRTKTRTCGGKSRGLGVLGSGIQNGQPASALLGDQPEDEEENSDEDDEDEAQFWNNSANPTPAATPGATRTPIDDDGSGTITQEMRNHLQSGASNARVHLTVRIAEPVDDRHSPASTPEPSAVSASSQQTLTPTEIKSSGGAVDRRASFRRDTWAFRPKAEEVYDHLQDFFPDHDLDKTFIEPVSSGGLSPTTGVESPPPPLPTSKENKYRHRKSLRYVAEERKKALDKISTTGSDQSVNSKAANVARKRSTKLWGSKIEEVTPGQIRAGIMPTVPESPTGALPVRPTIKWVKGDLIGKGTYGKVFLALNATTGEMLAVKQVEMPQSISDQDDQRQVNIVAAIKAERDTLERLDHINIVQYLGFEQTHEFFNVFLEYVPGGSIGSILRKQGKFEENVVRFFTAQIVEGLAYLHSNKIIHRDVKADNVLVDHSGCCKISDFGISKKSDEIYDNAAMTAMQGSLFWMAPEMLHNNKKGYNARIDIWSLGCVFIEMFAGRRPWEQDDFVSVMFKVGYNKMAPPVPDDVQLSPQAEDFRLKCFTEDPAERPTAEALRAHPWLVLPLGYSFPGFPHSH